MAIDNTLPLQARGGGGLHPQGQCLCLRGLRGLKMPARRGSDKKYNVDFNAALSQDQEAGRVFVALGDCKGVSRV